MECILSASIVQWSPFSPNQLANQQRVSHYSTGHHIFNCTGRSIGVARRDGTKFVIPPLRERQKIPDYAAVKNSIIVIVKDVFAVLPARCILNQADTGHDPENKIFHKVRAELGLREGRPGAEIADRVVDMTMHFPIDSFPEDQSAYCREIDYLFTIMPEHYNWGDGGGVDCEQFIKSHPDSPQGVLESIQVELSGHNEELNELLAEEGFPAAPKHENQRLAGSVFIQNMIFIEGDDSEYGKLYVRVKTDTGNRAVLLKPRKSVTKLPGLYLVTNARKDNQSSGKPFTIEHLTTPEQFALYGVFCNRKQAEQPDAETFANMEYSQKIRAAEINVEKIQADNRKLALQAEEADRKALTEREAHENKMQLLDREREKSEREHRLAMEQLESKTKAAEADVQLWREKFESERKKEQHENTSNKRKSFIEGSKLIATVVTVAFTLIKLLRDIFVGVAIKA